MGEAKWTPGPWSVERDSLDDGYFAYEVQSDRCLDPQLNVQPGRVCVTYEFDTPLARHDAHLIAAAPDLYEALAELVEMRDRASGVAGVGDYKARAALAKARGEVVTSPRPSVEEPKP